MMNSEIENNLEQIQIDFEEKEEAKPKPKPKRKSKKNSEPKRPLSIFFRFSKDNRANAIENLVKNNDKKPSVGEVSKELGKLWSSFKESKKRRDIQSMKQYTQEYEKEKEVYNEQKGVKVKKPLRALNGYIMYGKEHRATIKNENPGISIIEITKILSSQWKELDESEKKIYKDKGIALFELNKDK